MSVAMGSGRFRRAAAIVGGFLVIANMPVASIAAEDDQMSRPAAEESAPLPTLGPESPAADSEMHEQVERKSGTVLDMPPASEPRRRVVSMPEHGMKMAEVQRRYGSPRVRHPAVGKPPITRWDYDDFSVFFEYSTVLHSVEPDRPPEIRNMDELTPTHRSTDDRS